MAKIQVPDCLFPSNNDFEIPTLDLSMQGDYLDLPIQLYGHEKRDKCIKQGGTVLFYTDDYRFQEIWRHPEKILNGKIVNIGEVNYSIFDQTPFPIALYAIYRKRWLSKYWQTQGIRVFVDLNVSVYFREINLIGIPQGWSAFITRGYNNRIEDLESEVKIAMDKSYPNNLNMVVYGGGKEVKEFCQLNNLIHVREAMEDYKNRISKRKEKRLCQKELDQMELLAEAEAEAEAVEKVEII